jgi:hypothetical protein
MTSAGTWPSAALNISDGAAHRHRGATWLDRELISDAPVPARDAGFGHEVRDALARRRQWLIEQELARDETTRTIYRANFLSVLRQRELAKVGG